ncbi:MAG TPA: HD domain-containing phosphohydrolase [Thermoanaerobaculia bacterium]|nr:HD domain-containing phosphohydrolase [Thermoanaerobaculia bacterium]
MIATESGASVPLAFEPARRLAEYEMLLEVGIKLSGTLDPSTVLELALEYAEQVCQAETSSIWEVDEKRRDLFFRVVRGQAAKSIRGMRLPLGEGIVGSVALSGEAEMVNDVAADPRWHGDPSGAFQTRSILTVPLLAQGSVIGVVQLLNPVNRDRFTEGDLWRMRQFAAILAPPLQNARLHAAQSRQYLTMASMLADSLEKRDPYTGGHVRRVVGYSWLLGEEMGLGRDDLRDLWLAATLHDIGKISVPDRILGKPAPLDPDEAELMKLHTVFGAEIVTPLDNPKVLCGVRNHHERLDGKGYPDGLKDPEIPLSARIIAVADTFDAMTTSRPYRTALPHELAAAEIAANSGTQLCPRVVEAFRRLFEAGRFNAEAAEGLPEGLFEPG